MKIKTGYPFLAIKFGQNKENWKHLCCATLSNAVAWKWPFLMLLCYREFIKLLEISLVIAIKNSNTHFLT